MIFSCLDVVHAKLLPGRAPRLTIVGKSLLPVCLAIFGCSAMPSWAADRYTPADLMSMKIEDLVNVKVTTLSKREEKYMRTAGAVFVITRDDIRRSGVRSIPDALRLAPGLQVSQSNMNQWQIGIRGQSDFFTDLLLVMVDNRPVYTTTFSGVWWVTQNYPLEDIDRIEIVRGPGGAIWGSNAVNGVINIITRHAGASKGLRISGGAGTEDKGFGNIRYSGTAGRVDYRVYAMSELRDGGLATLGALSHGGYNPGDAMPDFRRLNQQGFRLDWETDASTRMSLHGDRYRVTTGVANYWLASPTPPAPANATVNYTGLNTFTGQNLVFRVEKDLADHVRMKGQLFYDQYKLQAKFLGERKDTFDADLQFDIADVMHQNISLGMNLRHLRSKFSDTPQFQMRDRSTNLSSFFINDELNFYGGVFRIIGGIKLERNSYTRWVSQPSIRAIVSDDNWALWAAASQAARTPNDSENNMLWNLKSIGPYVVQLTGSGAVHPERVTTYEVGGRLRPTQNSLIELTAFKIFYKGVPDVVQGAPNPATFTVPVSMTNVLNGNGDGIEANFQYSPRPWVTLKGSYTYLHQNYTPYPLVNAETLFTAMTNKGQDPANRFHVGLSLDPISNVEFDTNLYFTGPFRQMEGGIHGYHRLDTRLGWKPNDQLEMSVVGQDLLQPSYQSNIDNFMGFASRIQRRYYFNVTYRH